MKYFVVLAIRFIFSFYCCLRDYFVPYDNYSSYLIKIKIDVENLDDGVKTTYIPGRMCNTWLESLTFASKLNSPYF